MSRFKLVISAILSSLVLLGIQTPTANAVGQTLFLFEPKPAIAGSAVIIGLSVDECSAAPTTFDMLLESDNAAGYLSEHINKNHKSFKQTLRNNKYTAQWIIDSIDGKKIPAGDLIAILNASGGCFGDGTQLIDVTPVVKHGELVNTGEGARVGAWPGNNGMNVDWEDIEGADSYDLRFSVKDQDQWTTITGVDNSYYFLEAGTQVQIETSYDVQIRAHIGNNATDWFEANNEDREMGQARAWTSVVGDNSLSEVTSFNSSTAVQMNAYIEDCTDTSALLSENGIVVEVNGRYLSGLSGNDPIRLNAFVSSSNFKNFTHQVIGNDILLSWQMNIDLEAGPYTFGNYYLGTCGGKLWHTQNEFPKSEYTDFQILQNGKMPPLLDEQQIGYTYYSNGLKISWPTPGNPQDGPYTTELFTYTNPDDPSTYVKIAESNTNSIEIRNQKPYEWLELVLKISNGAGDFTYFAGVDLAGPSAKVKSKQTAKQFAASVSIQKKYAKSAKLKLTKYLGIKNSCTLKKNVLTYGTKPGFCNVTISWQEGKRNKKEDYLVSVFR